MPDLNFINQNLIIFILIIWESFWKAIALWKAAKKGDTLWFIAIFLINFFALLPLFYLWKTKQLDTTIKDIQSFLKLKFKKN